MRPDEIDATNKIELTRIQSGIFLAVASIFSPLLFPLAGAILSSDMLKDSVLASMQGIIMLLILAGVTFLWAGSIVRCITDIVREYSATSRFGLFLLLISPMVWLCLSAAYVYSIIESSFASYMTGLGLS
jgi:hypothetical protein